MTVSEVAQYLSLDPQTVSRKAQGGEIPAFKVGNRWRFDREDIDKWIGSQKKGVSDVRLRLERTWERIRSSAERRGLERSSIPNILAEIRSARSSA